MGARGAGEGEEGAEGAHADVDRARGRGVAREVSRWVTTATSWCCAIAIIRAALHTPPPGTVERDTITDKKNE